MRNRADKVSRSQARKPAHWGCDLTSGKVRRALKVPSKGLTFPICDSERVLPEDPSANEVWGVGDRDQLKSY